MQLINVVMLSSTLCCQISAWTLPPVQPRGLRSRPFTTKPLHDGLLDPLTEPFESKIPEELRAEIYEAEANTPAAKKRGQRVIFYTLIALVGVSGAFFNYFLGDLRAGSADIPPIALDTIGFGWVESNFVTGFLFLNKVGGLFLLLGGAGSAFLAESELDSRRVNSERIYEEMVKRREKKVKKMNKLDKKGKKKGKNKRSGKETKRLSALSEVIDTTGSNPDDVVAVAAETTAAAPVTTEVSKPPEDKREGIVGKMKGFYEKADSMAASQALLLNKKLEDAGVLEKITDESGLKVVGKATETKNDESDDADKKPK